MCATNADGIKSLKPEDESIIVEKVLENISTGEDLQNLVSDIYDWTLLDPALTSCVASLCATLAKYGCSRCSPLHLAIVYLGL